VSLWVVRGVEHRTDWSIKKFVRTARRYRTIEIQAGYHTITAAEPLPDDLHHVLDATKIEGGLTATLLPCAAMSRRRYVASGVPGGYRTWDNKGRRWWGDLYELCPDELLDELNGACDYAKVAVLLRLYRTQKR
jgi:hypothetical protein